MAVFPHMKDTEFPNVQNVNVYKYENELDYSRYDYTQMKLCLCCVPWDMGEAHIGNRTISGIGNVVYFGNEQKRDEWFSNIPDGDCVRFETKFKELHRDNQINIPVPFDVASRYNYLTVEYSLFANDDSPLEYETENGLKKWFWFVREVEFVSPNTTKLHLMNDAWQTFIYGIDIPYMVLERGHAPLFETKASTYLANPLETNVNLLEPDSVLETVSEKIASSSSVVFDSGDMYAIFVTSAAISKNWGTNNSNSWIVPAQPEYHTDGNLSYRHLALPVSDLYDFLDDVESAHPQFKQTVKCVYLASSKLLTLGNIYEFAGHSLQMVSCTEHNELLLDLDISSFGYDVKYKDLAKLYTYPYAHIEVTDENGNVSEIRIEDTTGMLELEYAFNTAFPALNLNARVLGVGSTSTSNVQFKNVNTRTFRIGGKWYEIQYDWAIPTFGVVLQASKEYDYSGYFEREQREVEYTASYNNALASNSTAKTNADNSAATAKSNTTVATTAQKAAATRENSLRQSKTNIQNDSIEWQRVNNTVKLVADRDSDNQYTATAQTLTTSAEIAQTFTNTAAGVAGSIGMGALTGGIAGAAIGAAGATIQTISAVASTSILATSNLSMATLTQSINTQKTKHATDFLSDNARDAAQINTEMNTVESNANTAIAKIHADSADDQATNTKSTANTNAANTKTTADANALRTKNAAASGVTNKTRQEGMNAPYEFGTWANSQNANIKPKMVCANIVTQAKSAIAFAGDEFLRYGYRLNRNWAFDGNWCIGKNFTYWKLSDFWIKGLNIPDMYVDKIRFFLFGGVTVWSDPAKIGHVSIYDNWA